MFRDSNLIRIKIINNYNNSSSCNSSSNRCNNLNKKMMKKLTMINSEVVIKIRWLINLMMFTTKKVNMTKLMWWYNSNLMKKRTKKKLFSQWIKVILNIINIKIKNNYNKNKKRWNQRLNRKRRKMMIVNLKHLT